MREPKAVEETQDDERQMFIMKWIGSCCYLIDVALRMTLTGGATPVSTLILQLYSCFILQEREAL